MIQILRPQFDCKSFSVLWKPLGEWRWFFFGRPKNIAVYMCVCIYLYTYWLIVDLLPFITIDWEGETSGWAAISALFPTEATGSPAELWIEFPQKLGKSKFQPCPIHPPIWNISACSSDVQIWRHMNDDNNKHWFIYRIFADSSMNKKGFAALKRHFFSPANILCWTKKNEECDSHMMSPETWGCCQPKWSDTNKCCFLINVFYMSLFLGCFLVLTKVADDPIEFGQISPACC